MSVKMNISSNKMFLSKEICLVNKLKLLYEI